MYGTVKCTKGCRNCEGDCDAGCGCYCCRNNDSSNKEGAAGCVKISVIPAPSNCYVMQILNCGINSGENFYETRLALAPEIDVSSVKITVKNNNLRVTARRPLGELAGQLPEIYEKSALGDLVKRTMKQSENFLIPNNIDGEKVRAVMDNKQRILILTAPFQKTTKIGKKHRELREDWIFREGIFPFRDHETEEKEIDVMDKLPYHCQENAYFFKREDYMNLEMKTNGVRTSFKFNKVPDIYTIDDREYFAAEIKVEGFKVGAAALAGENILNVKLHEIEGSNQVRNFNFLIPGEANALKISVEVFNGNTIFLRAPLRKKNPTLNNNINNNGQM